jgi:putative endonuclease
MEKEGYVYILTNEHNKVLYTGVSSDLSSRISDHKNKRVKGFTKKYNCTKLVYCEACGGIEEAIAREKQIKGGSRQTKIDLIQKSNPNWSDLSELVGS